MVLGNEKELLRRNGIENEWMRSIRRKTRYNLTKLQFVIGMTEGFVRQYKVPYQTEPRLEN